MLHDDHLRVAGRLAAAPHGLDRSAWSAARRWRARVGRRRDVHRRAAMGGSAPILALLGMLEPIPALDGAVGNAVGVVLAVGGISLTFGAQLAMGDSWRVGVDPDERTELVTGGPFGLVRNPIYSAMLPTVFGLVLMVPSAVAICASAPFRRPELQVRLVEEPYLLQGPRRRLCCLRRSRRPLRAEARSAARRAQPDLGAARSGGGPDAACPRPALRLSTPT